MESYLKPIKRFLRETGSTSPTLEDVKDWHGDLAESRLARSTVNIWGAALKAFYKSRGMELTLPYLKVSNKVPYFFSEDEVLFRTFLREPYFSGIVMILPKSTCGKLGKDKR